ncbi:uncharacterized protein I303_105133 [Kwoniella dejecticola CBS 10117]|uniref:DUF3835 domain-containing protein n=1 Tax=Kwoniella dejecticola CBS 10117 TaxID=1296121 RepID=A0A1A6A3C7_9TREE|nr:uncharacterized protein I303_05422 [Kwoniella dejecticola CBS 10117]OBR84563.1 hypothetical protein I303_05422 [Kwoniella dejecticola CBS 10117]
MSNDADRNVILDLPIVPTSSSLESHIQALDILSLRIRALGSPQNIRIPLGSKASLKAQVRDTVRLKVKVNVGGEWFVDMTLDEASEYVQRRKRRLLEEHALILEAKSRAEIIERLRDFEMSDIFKEGEKAKEKGEIGFHPILYSIKVNSQSQQSEEVGGDIESKIEAGPSSPRPSPRPKEQDIPADLIKKAESSNISGHQDQERITSSQASLVDLIENEDQDEDDEDEDEQDGMSKFDESGGDDTTLNEEGLPIHEIRETLSGETIGPPPPPTVAPPSSSPGTSSASQSQARIEEQEEDDYFSPEAVARRAALRRKLFNEDTSSDEEADTRPEDRSSKATTAVAPTQKEPIKAVGGIIRSKGSETSGRGSSASQEKSGEARDQVGSVSIPTSTSEVPSRSAQERRPSSSSSQPVPSKSILKHPHPPTRKKSVTFDPSIPSPPTSPPLIGPLSTSALSKFGFPLPLAVTDDSTERDEFAPKPVPVIPAPQPKQRTEGEGGFAGFKRGFLGASSSRQPNSSGSSASPLSSASIPPDPLSGTASTSTSNPATPPKKKQSLFSQRLKQPEIDASAPNAHITSASSSGRIAPPNLPKVSESKGTNTVKSGVVEKAPPPAAVQSVVKERPTLSSNPADGLKIIERDTTKSIPPASSGDSKSRQRQDTADNQDNGNKDEEEDEAEEEEEDEFSDYSTGEEDEYDLDEALLAREVALEYHRRQAYKPLNRDPDDPAMDDEGGLGGVMLGLPSISNTDTGGAGDEGFQNTGMPMIVNPTPDDLRRFVRVGRLENGNLVLAPGEESLDTDEDENEDGDQSEGKEGVVTEESKRRRERKLNRENVKRQLMGLEIPDSELPSGQREQIAKKEKRRVKVDEEWKGSLPPSLATDQTLPRPHEEQTANEPVIDSNSDINSRNTGTKAPMAMPIIPLVPESPPSSALSTTAKQPSTVETTMTRATAPQAQAPEKPKKISKFKAARMAANQ